MGRIKKENTRRKELEYQEMINSICGMFDKVHITPEVIEKHIRRVSEEELADLICISKSVPPEEPWPGNNTPREKNFITQSMENNPDKVYLLKMIEPLCLNEEFSEPPSSSNWGMLDIEEMDKDLYVFLYDSFGFPETRLCARRGYVLYDTDKKDIVAYHWTWIS